VSDVPDHRIVLSGEYDLANAGELEQQLIGEIDSHPAVTLVLDFSSVTFIDSSALAALITAHKHAIALGGSVRVEHPSSGVERLFEVSGLRAVFSL
jgi:anti-anti-sigma factor